MPIAAAHPNDSSTAAGVTTVDHCITLLMPYDAAMPSATPRAPPARLSTTASTRNCMSTSTSRAPTDRRSPISRVRSVTDTSMMFMIPMPPTSNETAAMLASRYVIVVVVAVSTLAISSRLRTEKSSGSPATRSCLSRSNALICSSMTSNGTPSAVETMMFCTCVMPSSFFCTVV